MKKKTTIAIVIVLVLCSTIFVAHYFFIGSWSSSNINRYIEVTKCITALPKMEDLGSYSDIEFKYYRKNMLMFFSDAYTLKVSYDNENYQKEKDKFYKTMFTKQNPCMMTVDLKKNPALRWILIVFKCFLMKTMNCNPIHTIWFLSDFLMRKIKLPLFIILILT